MRTCYNPNISSFLTTEQRMPQITHVVKRNGTLVPFTPERITNAIYRAAVAVGGRDRKTSQELASQVVALLERNTPRANFLRLNKSRTWSKKS